MNKKEVLERIGDMLGDCAALSTNEFDSLCREMYLRLKAAGYIDEPGTRGLVLYTPPQGVWDELVKAAAETLGLD